MQLVRIGAAFAATLSLVCLSAPTSAATLPAIPAGASDAIYIPATDSLSFITDADEVAGTNTIVVGLTGAAIGIMYLSHHSGPKDLGLSDSLFSDGASLTLTSFDDQPHKEAVAKINLGILIETGLWQDVSSHFSLPAESVFVFSELDAPNSAPLPAALPMFMGGAGLISLLARRKKKRAA